MCCLWKLSKDTLKDVEEIRQPDVTLPLDWILYRGGHNDVKGIVGSIDTIGIWTVRLHKSIVSMLKK